MDSNTSPKPPIRFCINNPRNLAERQDLITKGIPSKDCLGNCSACFEGHFLEIQGQIIPGDSYQQILNTTKPQ
ncbi:MAG: hypothetical protein JKY43_00500 [Phycisphaerales bacterium]|nr:hypothetical protein [Phycisphaerales bacterium]